jgi:thiol-disulfide isomerase/thioredoxin
MNSFLRFIISCLVCLLSYPAHAVPPETLTLPDLVNRPERWPETVTVNKNINFENGKAVRKGQKAEISDFDGKSLSLFVEDSWKFSLSHKDCDLLNAANQAWSVLTPAQRSIEPTMLSLDPSLWPVQIKLLQAVKFNDGGGGVAAGAVCDFISMNGNKVSFYSDQAASLVTAPFTATDLIKRAQQLALIPSVRRPSRVAHALKKTMVDASGRPYTDPNLEDVQIFALYYGGSWCAPCRAFTPTLVDFVNEKTPGNPYFKAVMISNDPELSAMLDYMKEKAMPWPAVPMATVEKSAFLQNYETKKIPTVIICDRSGKLLATSLVQNGDGYAVDTASALQSLTKILDSGAAR